MTALTSLMIRNFSPPILPTNKIHHLTLCAFTRYPRRGLLGVRASTYSQSELDLATLRSLACEFNHISTGIINTSHKTYVRHIFLNSAPSPSRVTTYNLSVSYSDIFLFSVKTHQGFGVCSI